MRAIVAGILLMVGVPGAFAEDVALNNVLLDRSPDAVRRGAIVVANVCMGCHSLRFVRYRDLRGAGISGAELTAIQGGHALEDAMTSAMDDESAIASFGRVPPDQSILAKARAGGAQYIYSFVTAFERDASGAAVNRLIPSTKMPDILGFAASEGADRAAAEQQARDAAVFLEWASDPRAAERKSLGRWVLGYLTVLTLLLYFVKRRVWKRVPPLNTP